MKGKRAWNWKHGSVVDSECQRCKAPFKAWLFDVKKGMGRFCSRNCFHEWTKETGSRIGDKNSNWQGGISRTSRTCILCGVGFDIPTKELKRGQAGKFCSMKCYMASATDQRFPRHNHYASGRRADLKNIFFRSSWEANWARYLNFLVAIRDIKSWEFEPDTFWFEKIRRGVRSYTPDFKITRIDGSIFYQEVKGYMDARSSTKLKRMKKYHPLVAIELVDKTRYLTIRRQLSKMLKGWE